MKLMFAPILFIFLVFPIARSQEVYSVEGCFDSYVQGTYCFVDMEGTTYQFEDMDPTAKEKYDLTDGNYQGRMFTVVYRIETSVYEDETEDEAYEEFEEQENEEENDEEAYGAYIIVDLELVG